MRRVFGSKIRDTLLPTHYTLLFAQDQRSERQAHPQTHPVIIIIVSVKIRLALAEVIGQGDLSAADQGICESDPGQPDLVFARAGLPAHRDRRRVIIDPVRRAQFRGNTLGKLVDIRHGQFGAFKVGVFLLYGRIGTAFQINRQRVPRRKILGKRDGKDNTVEISRSPFIILAPESDLPLDLPLREKLAAQPGEDVEIVGIALATGVIGQFSIPSRQQQRRLRPQLQGQLQFGGILIGIEVLIGQRLPEEIADGIVAAVVFMPVFVTQAEVHLVELIDHADPGMVVQARDARGVLGAGAVFKGGEGIGKLDPPLVEIQDGFSLHPVIVRILTRIVGKKLKEPAVADAQFMPAELGFQQDPRGHGSDGVGCGIGGRQEDVIVVVLADRDDRLQPLALGPGIAWKAGNAKPDDEQRHKFG